MRSCNPVLLLLIVCGVAGATLLPFLNHAPNRLLSGQPVMLGARAVALLPAAGLLVCALLPPRRPVTFAAGACALLLLGGLCWLAGDGATALAQGAPRAARTSLGAGFWVAALAAALCWGEAAGRLARTPVARTGLGLLGLGPPALLLASGRLDQLSLLREFSARHDEVAAALLGHLRLVGLTLLIATPLGLVLGLLAQRRPAWRGPVFAVLNVVQTVPSIALFGLLLAPLAASGVGGIGAPPAIIALTLYALLPLARTTAEGLDGVSPAVTEAARGMGMGPARILLQIEAPLALPALLAGIRITTVQAIGLAVIAALIGAGGLGSLVFEGLSANALDLVMLGVVPVVLLAVLADAGLRILASVAGPPA